METVRVNLPGRQYPILIGRGLISRAGEFLADVQAGPAAGYPQRPEGTRGYPGCRTGSRVVVVTNPTVSRLYGEEILAGLGARGFAPFLVEIPDGEEYKTLESVARVYEELFARQLDRGSTLVALGGGVVGDLTGFVAATFMRGIRYLQVPTTLLAQVDSSVGGKTGVNHPRGKNLIGAFHQPAAVITDVEVLRSLSPEEFRSGLAEVVKYGAIADPDFFAFLESSAVAIRVRDEGTLVRIVKRCCEIKASYVEQDEREESGLRAHLNFGHTFAHALETATSYCAYRHGEAVAVGMACAARLSALLNLCGNQEVERLSALLKSLELPVNMRGVTPGAIAEALVYDKKAVEGTLRFILMKTIGQVFLADSVPFPEVRKILKWACIA
ncbi:MAG: 3-dehydroquinate synthase [Candidatus Tectomicrobia bacterium]|uniref:3-dehydroquinate synthase n=1 Tax=Tectimicrobiota bacterium TaxID=2528274 RepID=A0A932M094_UNCTE|nr:3-dehydroquinate synthase [Candidatus Tectomicrobia bacterium]